MANPLFKAHNGVTHTGTIKIDPSNIDKFLEAFRACWLECCKEPECIYFEVFHSRKDTGVMHFVEVWDKDDDWFVEVQIKKDYYKAYWDITKPMWISRQMNEYDRIAGWNYVNEKYLQGAVLTKAELK